MILPFHGDPGFRQKISVSIHCLSVAICDKLIFSQEK